MKKIILFATLISIAKGGYVQDHKDEIIRDMVSMKAQELYRFFAEALEKRAERLDGHQSRTTSPIRSTSPERRERESELTRRASDVRLPSPTRASSPAGEILSEKESYRSKAVSDIKELLNDFINDRKNIQDMMALSSTLGNNEKLRAAGSSDFTNNMTIIRAYLDSLGGGAADIKYFDPKDLSERFLAFMDNKDMIESLKKILQEPNNWKQFGRWMVDNRFWPKEWLGPDA